MLNRAAGCFTFGGTGTNLYGNEGRSRQKPYPRLAARASGEEVAIIGSAASHYCRYSIASWLGIGADNVISVSCDANNAMSLPALHAAMRQSLQRGTPIVGIVATMGTTDAFGIDDLAGIVARYVMRWWQNSSFPIAFTFMPMR